MAAVARVGVELDARGAVTGLNRLNAGVKGLVAQVGIAVGGVTALKKSLDAAFAREAQQNRLKSLVDTTKEYTLAVNAAAIASKRFGVTQTQAQEALGTTLGRLKALGLNLAQVESIYTGFNVIAREARISTEDASGAFLQLSQALGAGSLQGDELRSILERMPQLAQAIAESMGVSAGKIKQLGSDGKIGLTEIKNALDTAAKRADNLNGTFTKQQATMALVRQRAEELGVQLGKTLAPVYLTILDGMANAAFVLHAGFKATAKVAEKNAELIRNIVTIGLRFAAIAGGVYLVVQAYKAWQAISKAVAATQAFIVGLSGPTGLGLVVTAVGAATAAAVGLDQAFKGVEGAIAKAMQEGNVEFAKMKQKTLEQLAALKKTGDQITANTELTKRQTQSLNDQAAALRKQVNAESIRLKRDTAFGQARNKVYQEQISAELKINQLAIQRAKQKGNTFEVLQLELRQVELIYQQTVAQVKAEVERARLKVRQVEIATKELEIANLRKKAENKLQEADKQALALQKQVLGIAKYNVQVAAQVAEQQIRGAQATAIASKEALQFAYNQERAAQAANRTANAVARTARAAGGGGGGSRAGDTWMVNGKEYTFQGSRSASRVGSGISIIQRSNPLASTAPSGFAEGGYITRPTSALIGERGENEYLIPESKMNSAIKRYTRGARGESVVEGSGETSAAGRKRSGATVNISTGPVMQMDGQDYVTVSDLNEAVGNVAAAMSSSDSEGYGGKTRLN